MLKFSESTEPKAREERKYQKSKKKKEESIPNFLKHHYHFERLSFYREKGNQRGKKGKCDERVCDAVITTWAKCMRYPLKQPKTQFFSLHNAKTTLREVQLWSWKPQNYFNGEYESKFEIDRNLA